MRTKAHASRVVPPVEPYEHPAERALAVIQQFAGQHKALARCKATLTRDLLALLTGLKPSIMLDYCFKLPILVLQQLLMQLTHAVGQPGTASHITGNSDLWPALHSISQPPRDAS